MNTPHKSINKVNGNEAHKIEVNSDLSAEDSDGEIELIVQKVSIKTHKDFQLKFIDEEKRLIFYIDLCPADLINLMKNSKNKFDDERRHIKNCIFFRKFQTPNSGIKGNFNITYLSYKGISFNIYINRPKSQNNFQMNIPLLTDQRLYARMKLIYDNDEIGSEKKFINKWFECISSEKNDEFFFNISAADTNNIFNDRSTLMLQIFFDRNMPLYSNHLGILNQGNMCYINSFIQVLFHFIPFRKLVVECPKSQIKSKKLIKYLQEIFVDLCDGKICPNAECLLEIFPQFNSYPREQQDIHEFMISLFDELEKECPEMNQFWCGKDTQIIKSVDKRYESKQEQDFNQLQLHIIDTKGNSLPTIKSAMKQLLAEQKFQDELETDQYGKITASKVRNIQFLPPLLFLNIKRYEYNTKRKQLKKINLEQTYDYELEVDFLMMTPGQQLKYILYSVVIHKGKSPNSGHYFTFVNLSKHPQIPEFYEFNDSTVNPVNPKKVLHNYTGKKKIQIYLHEQYGKWAQRQIDSQETAYMLVYIRKDKFIEFQTMEYTLPSWHLQRLQKKLTEQQAKTKIQCKIFALKNDQQFYPFSLNHQFLEPKLDKFERIQDQIRNKIEVFLGDFVIDTIWKVNVKARTIKDVGRMYGEKCRINLSNLCQFKRGFRYPDYFLLIDKQKSKKIDKSKPIGILHIEQITQNDSKTLVKIIQKSKTRQILKSLQADGCNLTFNEEDLQYFQQDWNDYLFLKKQ